MKNKKILNLLWQIALVILVVIGDRVVKGYILNNVAVGEVFGEIPFVCDFLYVKNTGAAFSILSNNIEILSVISVVFLVAVIVYKYVRKPQNALENLSIALFFSGALGNAIDRIAYGFVVDFISIKWFEFPVFNVADMAIVTGAVIMVVYVIFFDKSEAKENG